MRSFLLLCLALITLGRSTRWGQASALAHGVLTTGYGGSGGGGFRGVRGGGGGFGGGGASGRW